MVYVLSRFCLSVSVSVTSQCYTKIANRRITLTMPNDKNKLSRCTNMFGDSSSAKHFLIHSHMCDETVREHISAVLAL